MVGLVKTITTIPVKKFFTLTLRTLERRLQDEFSDNPNGNRLIRQIALLQIRQDLLADNQLRQTPLKNLVRQLYFTVFQGAVIDPWYVYLLPRLGVYFTQQECFFFQKIIELRLLQVMLVNKKPVPVLTSRSWMKSRPAVILLV